MRLSFFTAASTAALLSTSAFAAGAPPAAAPAPAAPAPAAVKVADDGTFALSCTPAAQEHFWKGLVLMWNGHDADMVAEFAQSAGADANCAAAKFYLALVKPTPDSTKHADEAIAAAAKLPEVERTFLGIMDGARKGDSAAQIAAAKKLTELTPKSWIGFGTLAGAYLGVGQREDALAAAKKSTELGPKVGAAWNQLAYANLSMRKYDDAVAALKKYTEVAPMEPNAHDTLGDALLDQAKLDEAEAEYKKAIEVSKDAFFISHNGVAGVRFMKGDFDGGRAELAKQKALQPDGVLKLDVDNAVVWSFVVQGKATEALAALDAREKDAVKANGVDAIAFAPVTRADVLVELAKYDDALKSLAAAEKTDISKLSAGGQRNFRAQRALDTVTAHARNGKVADAEKAVAAVETEAKTDAGDPRLQDMARIARAEVLLAKKDGKGAAAQLKDCLREDSYCQWRRVVALEAAGDKAGADAVKADLMKEARRDLGYVFARSKVAPKAK